jgi:hypothetical protein
MASPGTHCLMQLGQCQMSPFSTPCSRPFYPVFSFKGSLVDPRMRASNEHIPIVRVPRAGGRPGYPFSNSDTVHLAHTTSRAFLARLASLARINNSLASYLFRFRWSPLFSQPPSRWRRDLRDLVSLIGTGRLSIPAMLLHRVHRREPRTLSPVAA